MAKRTRQNKVPVTMRALLQRINRALADNGEILKVTRGSRAIEAVGRYYTIDARNRVTKTHLDPVKLAQELGVLQPYEHAEDWKRETGKENPNERPQFE